MTPATIEGFRIGDSVAVVAKRFGNGESRAMNGHKITVYKKKSGALLRIAVDANNDIILIDEYADNAVRDDVTFSGPGVGQGAEFNESGHINVEYGASERVMPGQSFCKSRFGADCWLYVMPDDLRMRIDFGGKGMADGELREVTLGAPETLVAFGFK